MSDDLFESFGSDDLFEEEETENQPEGEGQNKTFIIAVAALGALLVISLILFGVWAFVINPRMQANLQPTESAVVAEETPSEDISTGEGLSVGEENPTNTPEPTDTPEPPTPTPVVGPTRTPTPEVDEASGGDEDSGEGELAGNPTPTGEPRRTPTPSPTRRPTATPKATERPPAGAASESLSQTGLGEVLLILGAVALIGVAFFARRIRSI
jgi:hypothetical protein